MVSFRWLTWSLNSRPSLPASKLRTTVSRPGISDLHWLMFWSRASSPLLHLAPFKLSLALTNSLTPSMPRERRNKIKHWMRRSKVSPRLMRKAHSRGLSPRISQGTLAFLLCWILLSCAALAFKKRAPCYSY